MIQFSEERILQLRKRVLQNTKALEMLKSKCDFFFKYGVKVPPKTLSTWIMDFICPVDSSKLIYDYSNSESFTCPVLAVNTPEILILGLGGVIRSKTL